MDIILLSDQQSKSGELHGYTCSTVSIKKDDIIYTYNEKNKLINSIPSK